MYDWQTEAMTRRKYEINAQMRFYKQEYCGCSYSLRDNNLYRKMHGQPPVRIGGEEAGVGSRYYVDPEADAAEESQEEVDAFRAELEHSMVEPFHQFSLSKCAFRDARTTLLFVRFVERCEM